MRQLPKFPWQLIMYSSAIVFSNLSFPITAKPIFRPYGEVVILASNFIAANRHTVFAIAASYYIHHVSIGYNLRVFVKPICPAQCITCRAAICYCCTLRACRALFTPFHDFALQNSFFAAENIATKTNFNPHSPPLPSAFAILLPHSSSKAYYIPSSTPYRFHGHGFNSSIVDLLFHKSIAIPSFVSHLVSQRHLVHMTA